MICYQLLTSYEDNAKNELEINKLQPNTFARIPSHISKGNSTNAIPTISN